MKLSKIVMASVFAMGVVGCSGSSSSTPVSGTTAGADINEVPSGGSTSEGTTDSTGTTDSAGPTGGTNIGANPGILVSPILGESTSIAIADVGGHKLYGGPDAVYNLSSLYANYQFDCDGTGSFETFPTEVFAFLFPPVTGTITWEADGDRMNVDIVSSSDGEDGLLEDVWITEQLNDGVFVVGESSLDGRLVSHILQFEECT